MNDKKASYTLRSNIRFLFGLQWKTSKHSLTLLVITIPCAIMLSFLAAYFPKTVAYNIINNIGLFETIISIVYISLDIAILNIIIQVITVYNTALMANFRREVTYLINKKILQTDYENIENPDFRQLMQRAKQAVWGSGSGSTVERFSEITIKIVIHILTFFMFATVLALVNPYLIAILLSLSILNYYLVNKVEKYQYKNRKKISAIDQKLWYIAHNSGDISGAKDIRLFNMQNMFTSLFEKFTKERLNFSKKIAIKHYNVNIVEALAVIIREAITYGILIHMFIGSQITIDNFIFYLAAINSVTNSINVIVNNFIKLNQSSYYICDLRDFLEYKDKTNEEGLFGLSNIEESEYSIEINGLYFKYISAENDTIKNVSLKIKTGEKIALVGLNGAGKTTLIKLICGLYFTDRGEILVNGVNNKAYNIHFYYSLFSTVFQDHYFLPVSIADIVSGGNSQESGAREKIAKCITLAGLDEKINSLEQGVECKLNKKINENGIDLSGGEKQKLLLARALYKNAPILILDEPSSALDPIAEKGIYNNYNQLTQNKTSIFVSHRLASTRFCDRIIYLEKGQIVEEGTHDELVNMNGKYAELFRVQSQYYREEESK